MSNKLKSLVEEIQFKENLTQQEIADRIGYSRPYLTNAIKNGTEGKVLSKVMKEFEKTLQYITKNTDLNQQAREWENRIMQLENQTDVLKQSLAALYSQVTGKQAALVLSELDEVERMAWENRIKKLRRKSG